MATGEDLRWLANRGGEITATRFLHWYIDQVIHLIPVSAEVYRRFQEVNHMLKPAGALFHPAVSLPILRRALAALWPRVAPGDPERGRRGDRLIGHPSLTQKWRSPRHRDCGFQRGGAGSARGTPGRQRSR